MTGLLALGDDLAHDVDALGFQPLQVGQVNEGALLECGHRLLTVDEIGAGDPRLRPAGAFAEPRAPQARASAVDTRTVNPSPDSAESRPMEAEAQLDALFSQSGVGMTIVDRDLRIVRVNRGLRGLRRSTPASSSGKHDRRGRCRMLAPQIVPADAVGARDRACPSSSQELVAKRDPDDPANTQYFRTSAARSSRPTARSSASRRPSSRSPTCGTCRSRATTRSRASARAMPPSSPAGAPRPRRSARYRTIFDGASIGIIRVDRTGQRRRGESRARGRCSATAPPSSRR